LVDEKGKMIVSKMEKL